MQVLDSLARQTVRPNKIYINLPYKSKRTGAEYAVPSYLSRYEDVEVLRSEDYGPLTKLYPTLLKETDPDTIIITVDNDKIYNKNMVSHLVWYAEHDDTVAWGMCGWSFMFVQPPRGCGVSQLHCLILVGVVSVYTPWFMRHWGANVDVLQAACGNAYRRKFFNDLKLLEKPHTDCFKTDDMWISGYLATIEHIPRFLTPGPVNGMWKLEPEDTGSCCVCVVLCCHLLLSILDLPF
jgi:hypothetical protein